MDEGKFWLRMWLIGAVVLTMLVTSCTINGFDRRDKWEKAVANGADPIRASCALLDMSSTGDQILCALNAAK
jgi:hypothetical protein